MTIFAIHYILYFCTESTKNTLLSYVNVKRAANKMFPGNLFKRISMQQQHATTCKVVSSVLTTFLFNEKLPNSISGIHSKLGKLQALQIGNLNLLYSASLGSYNLYRMMKHETQITL